MSLPFFESAAGHLDNVVGSGMSCAFDFDGTLAPIVRDPDRIAVPAPAARPGDAYSRRQAEIGQLIHAEGGDTG